MYRPNAKKFEGVLWSVGTGRGEGVQKGQRVMSSHVLSSCSVIGDVICGALFRDPLCSVLKVSTNRKG